jgi:hypothetical protein
VITLSEDAEKGLEDLFFFANNYWGLQLEDKPHRWMCDEFMATLSMEHTPYLMLDVPRGCYKTSIVTAGAVWQYLRQVFIWDNPYHRILYASNTLELGESFLTLIENVLRAGGHEGNLTKDYGPMFKLPDRGNRKSSRQKEGLFLKPRMDRGEIASVKEPNFFIASIGALPIGKHADGAILDDLNNPRNIATPEQLKKTHDFYHQVYPIIHTVDRVGNPAHIWFNCTPWHDNDVRGMIVREEEAKKLEDPEYVSPWRVVKATAHMEDGSLFFPTKLSEKELARLKANMGTEYWAAYEGSPVTKDASIGELEQIRYKPREEFPALRWCRITLDPNQHSDAKVLGCYAAIAMGGYDQWGKLWVWDIRGGRDWDTGRMIDELYRAQAEHPTWSIFIEDEHMRHFDHAVNLEYVNRMHRAEGDALAPPVQRLRLNYIPAPRGLSKYERWQGALKPRFQSASIFFADEIAPSMKAELENEVTRGTAARFKDFLDALSMMENGITPRYKANGKGEVVQMRADKGGTTPRKPTFADAFGSDMFGG